MVHRRRHHLWPGTAGSFTLQWDSQHWLLSAVQSLDVLPACFVKKKKSILKDEWKKWGLQLAGASSVGVGKARGWRGIGILVTLNKANGKQRRCCRARWDPGPQTKDELTEMLWGAAGEAEGGTG